MVHTLVLFRVHILVLFMVHTLVLFRVHTLVLFRVHTLVLFRVHTLVLFSTASVVGTELDTAYQREVMESLTKQIVNLWFKVIQTRIDFERVWSQPQRRNTHEARDLLYKLSDLLETVESDLLDTPEMDDTEVIPGATDEMVVK